jgi:hypothetical protein
MESIPWMVPPDSPLVALTQQGVETASNIVAVASATENNRGEPSDAN